MMKSTNKLFFTMCMAAGLAFLMGSCKKNEETASIDIFGPQFEEEVDGRAYIDFVNGGKFKWNANDAVLFYNLDAQDGTKSEKGIYATTASAEGQTTGKFYYSYGDQLSAKKYGYFVFYPVDKVNPQGTLDVDNRETFTVPAEQNYTMAGNTPTVDSKGMAMASTLNKVGGGSFTLQHIFGMLRLRLKGTGNVTKIEVIDNRFNLNGTASMKLHEVDMDVFSSLQSTFIGLEDPYANENFVGALNEYMSTLGFEAQGGQNGQMMTLNCPNVALNTSTETYFYMGLRPGALKYGFTLKIYREGVAEPTVVDYTAEAFGHYGIKAGVVKNLAYTIL